MHKVTKHQMRGTEPAAVTPCHADPERYFPDEQRPDPQAVAACWSCFFQRDCALRAISLRPRPEHGIWGGYRLAPGPGLSRSRKQLRIIAGIDMGPAMSPGREVDAALLQGEGTSEPDVAQLETADGPSEAAAIDHSSFPVVDLAENGTVTPIAADTPTQHLHADATKDAAHAEVIPFADRTPVVHRSLHRQSLPLTVAQHHAPTG